MSPTVNFLEADTMKDVILMRTMMGFLLVLLVPLMARADWSDDPLQNLGIAVAAGDQALPKLAETSEGGCYISWFDNRSGSYCVYMQRLNSIGEAQWAPNGMLISSHTQMTWLVDYDMTVDQNDNAVVVFSDIRSGGTNDLDVFAYKIAPDGTFLWGPDGIGLSEAVNADFEPAPKVTATSDGNFVFGWNKSGATEIICFQKISAGGQKMWGPDGFTLSGASGESLNAPDLVAAEDDRVIALWKNSTGPPWAPTTHLYTQKFDNDGTALWGPSGVLIYNLGAITAWSYPLIHPDGNDGAFYTWYDAPTLAEFNVWVQHVDAGGNMVFPLNGVKASTNSVDRLHMYPTLSYLPASDELFVFWVEENGSQSQYGVYGQKFSPQGNRLWTDSGMEFVGLGGDQISFVVSEAGFNSIFIGYFIDATNSAVKAFRIKADGQLLCGIEELSSGTLGGKDDLLLVVNNEDRAFCTWDDGRNDIGDIYAQNMDPHGSLGNSLTANPYTISTAAGGTVDLALDAGVHNAGRTYLILSGVTGIDPGTVLPGGYALLPLNWDPWTDVVLNLVNTVLFQNFIGQIDPTGMAAAQINAPPLPAGFEGLVLNFAYCLNNFFDYASNHVEITIVN
jgi:hypothetical protein